MALLNVGMPGVGLGGIFYIVAALLMPVVEAARALGARLRGVRRTNDERRWRLALGQATLAGLVLGAAWLMGIAVSRVASSRAVATLDASGAAPTHSPLRIGTLALGLVLLTLVLGGIEVTRVLLVAPRRVPARTPDVERVDERLREVA